MTKIQFMKLKISNKCCSSQVINETSIVEWCIMDIKDFWLLMTKELKFKDYIDIDNEKQLEKLKRKLLEYGRVRDMGCEKCRIIYLFQHMKVKLSECINSSLYGDNSLWLQSDDIKTIENLADKI